MVQLKWWRTQTHLFTTFVYIIQPVPNKVCLPPHTNLNRECRWPPQTQWCSSSHWLRYSGTCPAASPLERETRNCVLGHGKEHQQAVTTKQNTQKQIGGVPRNKMHLSLRANPVAGYIDPAVAPQSFDGIMSWCNYDIMIHNYVWINDNKTLNKISHKRRSEKSLDLLAADNWLVRGK